MIYIPQKLKIGFQDRDDTYTGRLAYITYYDQKNKLRSEYSWNTWRDENIESEEHDNVPTSGFVVNKNAGGIENSLGYDVRKTYVRVYDPRGFEFEITIPNLLFILENTNSIKGKGLEGEFVYGWDRTQLVLIPTNSPDYNSLNSFAHKLQNSTYYLSPDELKIGYKYRIRYDGSEKDVVYMGKHNEYDYNFYHEASEKKKGKRYFFYTKTVYGEVYLMTVSSMKDRIIECLSDGVVENYAELLDELEHDISYSPISDCQYVPMSFDEFSNKTSSIAWREVRLWDKEGNVFYLIERSGCSPYLVMGIDTNGIYNLYQYENDRFRSPRKLVYHGTLREVYDYLTPHKRLAFLANGNLYSEAYCY